MILHAHKKTGATITQLMCVLIHCIKYTMSLVISWRWQISAIRVARSLQLRFIIEKENASVLGPIWLTCGSIVVLINTFSTYDDFVDSVRLSSWSDEVVCGFDSCCCPVCYCDGVKCDTEFIQWQQLRERNWIDHESDRCLQQYADSDYDEFKIHEGDAFQRPILHWSTKRVFLDSEWVSRIGGRHVVYVHVVKRSF